MSDERITFKFLGRTLGTGTGWDGDLGENWWIYNFQPASGVNLKPGDLILNEEAGMFEHNDANGNPTESHDMIPILSAIPRDPA
jgi:hypothetical protein